MITALLTLLCFILGLFLGFYLRVLLHTLIGIQERMSLLLRPQAQANDSTPAPGHTAPPVTFVEPMTLVDFQSMEEDEQIRALSDQ